MNNQNDNQTSPPTSDQDVLNQYASSVKPNTVEVPSKTTPTQDLDDNKDNSLEVKMSEAPKTTPLLDPPFVAEPQPSGKPLDSIPPQSTETTNPEVKESLKEFNSTPDTTTPASLIDNLEPSKSLAEESFLAVENEPEFKPEPQIELTPEPEVEPEPEPEFKSEPIIQTETSSLKPPLEDPEKIKQQIEEVLSYNTASNIVNPPSDKPKVSGFLKTLFTLSLLIFLAIVGALGYFYINPTSKTNPDSKTTVNPTDVPSQTNIPTQTSVVCELNGFIYNQGQSFPSADGCNTCTCVSADNVTCTDKPCPGTTTTPATQSAATPISTNKAGLNPDSYIGKTPFDPEKVKVGDIVLSNLKVAKKTINKYGFTSINTSPVLNGVDVEGTGDIFIFDKNKEVVCEGLPCCDEGSKDTVAIWQEEWCTGY